jgi:hypothetical protein
MGNGSPQKTTKRKIVMKKRTAVKLIGFAIVASGQMAHAAADTSALETLSTDAGTFIAYGVTAFLALLGGGLAITAGRWVYGKIKGGISAA